MLGILSTLVPLPAPSSTTLSAGHALSWVPIFSWRLHPTPLPSSHPLGTVGAGIHDFCLELFWAPGIGQKANVRNVLAILRSYQKLAFIVKKAGDLAENSKD